MRETRIANRKTPLPPSFPPSHMYLRLSGKLGSVTTNDCWAVCRLLTKLKSPRSSNVDASAMDSVTIEGRRAVQDPRTSGACSAILTFTIVFNFVFCRFKSITCFCKLSKMNFFLRRVRRAKIRFRSLLRSICSWLFFLGAPVPPLPPPAALRFFPLPVPLLLLLLLALLLFPPPPPPPAISSTSSNCCCFEVLGDGVQRGRDVKRLKGEANRSQEY